MFGENAFSSSLYVFHMRGMGANSSVHPILALIVLCPTAACRIYF